LNDISTSARHAVLSEQLELPSRLVLGTAALGSGSEREAFRLLDGVQVHGGVAFDTAYQYCEGESEARLGRWLAKREREAFFIVTKGGHPEEDRARITREAIAHDLDASLRRLGCDYIDLYLLHRDNERVPVAAVLEIMQEHVERGRVRAFGVSNWRHERIAEANAYAERHGGVRISASSPHFSLAVPLEPPWLGCVSIAGEGAAAARAFYRQTGMPLLAWSSLAMGFFGSLSPMAELSRLCERVFGSPDNLSRRARAAELAAEKGLTPTQIALMYVLSQPLNMHAIVGCLSAQEFAALAEVAERRLSPAEVAWLESGEGKG
jgi:aryl-alcohol dehydrogenase-like predicted oxidoreductase